VADGRTQDLVDQSCENYLARDFFADFQRRREIELFGGERTRGCSGRLLLPEVRIAHQIHHALLRWWSAFVRATS
jgi:hypothetical protein